MINFLANENIPNASVKMLTAGGLDVVSVSSDFPSIKDDAVIRHASIENRVILTFDRDYGELIFKRRIQPPLGVVYFRLGSYQPEDPAQIILKSFESDFNFAGFFTVITKTNIRQRKI